MTRRILLFATTLFVAPAFAVVGARADEIRPAIVITSGSAIAESPAGSLSSPHPLGTVDVTGTQRFGLQIGLGIDSTGPWSLCAPCGPPGTSLSLGGFHGALFSAFDGAGTVTLNGNSYVVPSSQAFASFTLSAGSVILPPLSTRAVLTAPFEVLRGSVLLFDFEGEPTVTYSLTGRGLATVELVPNPFAPLWEYSSFRYDFAPTPEPGTLLLLGTAAAIALVHRRRREKRDSRGGIQQEPPFI